MVNLEAEEKLEKVAEQVPKAAKEGAAMLETVSSIQNSKSCLV